MFKLSKCSNVKMVRNEPRLVGRHLNEPAAGSWLECIMGKTACSKAFWQHIIVIWGNRNHSHVHHLSPVKTASL